ncbi:MAG: GEVED domain-containing protein [Candidatus Eisenbacteria bacterium]|nr:GEVED domain-containing protein [Candidatus Eisenbacteria bacterium]
MAKKSFLFLAFLLCLILCVSTLYAGQKIRLYQDGVQTEIDLAKYLATGELASKGVGFGGSQKVEPGPAPAPYPTVYIWEKAIEQLGPTSVRCDGIRFINGNLWVPQKKALVLWTVRVPLASSRLADEFNQVITLSLWVDWNQDRKWGKPERMMGQNLNLQQYFPTAQDYLEFDYLSWFWIPDDSDFYRRGGGSTSGAPKAGKKLWVRCSLSYDDPDTSPDGECLFGEVEDYVVTYFNNKEKPNVAE